jgi:hypothetical protein
MVTQSMTTRPVPLARALLAVLVLAALGRTAPVAAQEPGVAGRDVVTALATPIT